MKVLNETVWGTVAPQIIGMAATEDQTRALLHIWIENRSADVARVFEAARERGEISADAPIEKMIEMAIAIPYFRKLMSGQPLDEEWLITHIDAVCSLGTKQTSD